MGRRNYNARSTLYAERGTQPVMGARHPIVDTDEVAFFFGGARHVLGEVLPGITSRKKDEIRRRDAFILYDDPDRMGVSILEQRLARTHAHHNRLKWTKNDRGRIRGEIQNELSRLNLTGRRLDVTFDNVVRLGDADEKKARKLALVPEQESEVAEFLCREHEIAIDGISGSLQRFRYPYSGDWIPHLTIGRVFKEVPQGSIGKAVSAIKQMMPLTVQIEPLEFYTQQHVPSPNDFMDALASDDEVGFGS
jgi:hypothetical protein